jgi:hypothetical protein
MHILHYVKVLSGADSRTTNYPYAGALVVLVTLRADGGMDIGIIRNSITGVLFFTTDVYYVCAQ